MARRYQRREFLIDASFMVVCTVLLKRWAIAPLNPSTQATSKTAATDRSVFTLTQDTLEQRNNSF
jgi:hypothetical protein